MSPTLWITRGLPASGKSTWARKQLASRPRGEMIRLNRDDLRRMGLDDDYRAPEHAVEKRITTIRDAALTAEWLIKHVVHPVFMVEPRIHTPASVWVDLHMRAVGDQRPDYVVKRELFDRHIRDRYAVRVVLDDRSSVVRQWRAMGLTVLQVAEGNF